MTTILCTLYNSLYLDKGLVLYDSLCECAKDFKLYVLCMDEKCFEVLTDLKQEYHIPVRLADFEDGDEELLKAKANRPMGEYCWTCSSSFIRYVLKHYNEDICTYIDADMFFYNDPQVLIDEMLEAKRSVMITPHRFPERDEKRAEIVGAYCVEFNTFRNTSESLDVLNYWRNRCLDCCSNLRDGVHWGDQKYLEELKEKFNCVYVCQNPGAGVAPWNICLYNKGFSFQSKRLLFKRVNEEIPIVFYHFQSVKYITRKVVNTGILTIRGVDIELVDSLYYPYLRKIESKKALLEYQYGITTLITHHPTDKIIPRWRIILSMLKPYQVYSNLKNRFLGIRPYIIELGREI